MILSLSLVVAPIRALPGALMFTDGPLLLVLAVSIVIGLVMVIVFRYTSDQKAIGRAKDRLKANLLAVRLFQDQIAGGDARLWQNSSRNRQLSAAGVHSVSDRDPAHYFSDRSA